MIGEFIIALLIALLLTLIFGVGLGGRGWGAGILVFFVVLFLATWAGGLWIGPYGPPLWGVSWLTFLLVGLFVVLLLAALAPRPPRTGGPGTRVAKRETEAPEGDTDVMAVGAFFWILMFGLIIAIIAAYL